MYNALIHKAIVLKDVIKKERKKDYKRVYLSPYSSFLNPTEEF